METNKSYVGIHKGIVHINNLIVNIIYPHISIMMTENSYMIIKPQ